MEKKLIGQYLVEKNLVRPEQLERALELQAEQMAGGHMPLVGTVLVEMHALKEKDLNAALADQERDRMSVTA